MPVDNDNSYLCPSPLPDKVTYPEIHNKKRPVPKLDLSGAKKIQENLINKLSPSAVPKANHVDPKLLEKLKL